MSAAKPLSEARQLAKDCDIEDVFERRCRAELIRLARSGDGAVHRVLTRLAESGLVTVTRVVPVLRIHTAAAVPASRTVGVLVSDAVATVSPWAWWAGVSGGVTRRGPCHPTARSEGYAASYTLTARGWPRANARRARIFSFVSSVMKPTPLAASAT